MPLVNETFKCSHCQRQLRVTTSDGTGYGRIGSVIVCYDCCALVDIESLEKGEPVALYLTSEKVGQGDWSTWFVANWSGTLKLPCKQSPNVSDHNIAGKDARRDVWFTAPDGSEWHGVNIGDNQIVRCHKLKKQKKDLQPLDPKSYIKPYPYAN